MASHVYQMSSSAPTQSNSDVLRSSSFSHTSSRIVAEYFFRGGEVKQKVSSLIVDRNSDGNEALVTEINSI